MSSSSSGLNRAKSLFVLLACLALATFVNGQQVIINSNGQRVVVYPDGSWRLYQEADTVLLRGQLAKEQVYSAEIQRQAFENTANNPGEVTGTTEVARQFADLTLRQSREANRELARVIDKQFEMEAKVKQAQNNQNFIEPDQLATIEEDYEEISTVVKEARKHQKKTTSFAADAQGILDIPPEKRSKPLNKLMLKHSVYYTGRSDKLTLDEGIVVAGAASEPVMSSAGDGNSSSPVKSEHTGNDVTASIYEGYSRKPVTCAAVVNQRDAKGRPEMIVISRNRLFSHTDADLRPYFRDKDLVTCSGQLSQIGEAVYLNIEFSIASPNAQKNFGSLKESSLMRLTLLDGSELDMFNLQGDNGRIDPYTGNTLFVGRYLLEGNQQRNLSKTEIDKMRVVWSAGYEDYEIYAVDFLIDQFSCLKSFQ